MKIRIKPRDFGIYLILLSIILYTLIDSTFKLYEIKYNNLTFIIAILVSFIALYLINEIKYLWASVLLLLFIPKPFYIFKHYKEFYDTTRGFIESLLVNQYIVQEYTKHVILLALILVPFISLLFFHSVIIRKQTLPILVFGSIINALYYYLGSNALFKNTSVFLSFSFLLYSFNQYMVMKKRLGAQDADIRSNYFKRLMSLSIILVLLVSFLTRILPYDFKPMTYEWVDKNIISRFENIKGRGDRTLSKISLKSEYSLSYTGFQPDPKRLGGPIETNNDLALRLVTDEKNKEIHLRGSIKDNYTGELWEKSDNTTQRFDSKIDSGAWGSQYTVKSITVFHEGIKTSTAFNVLFPGYLKNSFNYIFVDSELEIFHPKVIKKGGSYVVDYKDYNITSENNSRLKSSSEIKNNEELKKYLALPTLSERVYNLTLEITEKYNTPYEKASAIEHYLKKNYAYEKNTSTLPEGREFVDYFLFDEKKGYCTYYATSMAVMCRIANIPSRYVEGFSVTTGSSVGNSVDVHNSEAHSWVELYFENTGWVTFDPTPGHESPAMLLNADTNGETNTENPGANNNTPSKPQEKPNQGHQDEEKNNPADEETQKVSGIFIYVLAIGTFLIAVFLLYLIRNRFRYNNKSIKNLISLLILYGRYAKVPIRGGETIREYLIRLFIELGMENENPGSIIFEDVLYGGKTLTNEDILFIRELLRRIKQRVIGKIGRTRFLVLDFGDMLMFWKK